MLGRRFCLARLRLRVILGMGRARHNPARGVTRGSSRREDSASRKVGVARPSSRRSSPLRVVGGAGTDRAGQLAEYAAIPAERPTNHGRTATILTLFLARVTC